jgi:hypothetical protein
MSRRPFDRLTAEQKEQATEHATKLTDNLRAVNDRYEKRTGAPSRISEDGYQKAIRELEDAMANLMLLAGPDAAQDTTP